MLWSDLDDRIQSPSKQVLELVTQYGVENVTAACLLAIENKTPRACSIAQILAEGSTKPKTGIHLRLEASVPDLTMEWTSTANYDELYNKGK